MSAPTTINPSFYEEMLTYKKYSIESRIMDETTEDRVELGKLQVKSDANIKKMQVAMNNLMLKTQCLTLLRELSELRRQTRTGLQNRSTNSGKRLCLSTATYPSNRIR